MTDRPSLTADRWMRDDEPEFTQIRPCVIADIMRASQALTGIARILHNSIGDDMAQVRGRSIDDFTKQSLAAAVECISDFIHVRLEDSGIEAAQIEKWGREADHE